jgi:hypothetical protein
MKDWRVAVTGVAATIAVIGAAQAITDTAFRYSSPQVGYFSINPMAMTADSSTVVYDRGPSSISHDVGGAGCFGTGVNLPQGARMATLAVWFTSDNQDDPTFSIERQRLSDGALVTVAAVTGVDDSQTRQLATVTIESDVGTIDNSRYSYAFRFCPGSFVDSFRSARIRYIYRNAGD